MEYNGILHEEEGQIAVDVERANALEAMGYRMMTISRQSFFDGEAFGRLMRAIERRSGHRQVRVDSDFLFECDAYLPQAKVDLEYNGILHEEEGQIAVDVERANALEAMGYRMMTITRQSFFDGEAFGRLMRDIERRSGHRQVRVDSDFLKRQEELRRFMLRRYLAESGVADDEGYGVSNDDDHSSVIF